jgi:hypothetical protein
MIHRHLRDPRLSTPSVDLCQCGAVFRLGDREWVEPTSWEPPPWTPPPPRQTQPMGRSTTPLPLLLRDLLTGACR